MTVTDTETRSIVLDRELPFPADKVWKALTQPHLIEAWLMKNDFTPVAGHEFSLDADWGSVSCRVLTVEPAKSLSYTWDTKDLRSIVTWTLTPTATGTRLRMEQTGFLPEQQAYFRGAQAGWQRFIATLEQVLARVD